MSHPRRHHRTRHLYRLTVFLSTYVRACMARTRYSLFGGAFFLTSLTYKCALRQKLRPGKYHPDIFPHATDISRRSLLSTDSSDGCMVYAVSL